MPNLSKYADALTPHGDEGVDYVLNNRSIWITIGTISLWIRPPCMTGGTLEVEAYRRNAEMGKPIGSLTVTPPATAQRNHTGM